MFLKEKEDTNYNATQQRGKAKQADNNLAAWRGFAGEQKCSLSVLLW